MKQAATIGLLLLALLAPLPQFALVYACARQFSGRHLLCAAADKHVRVEVVAGQHDIVERVVLVPVILMLCVRH